MWKMYSALWINNMSIIEMIFEYVKLVVYSAIDINTYVWLLYFDLRVYAYKCMCIWYDKDVLA